MNLPVHLQPVLRQSPIAKMNLEIGVISNESSQLVAPACCLEACDPLTGICVCLVGGCD